MAAFKRHCAFVFWKDTLVVENPSDEAMGQLGQDREPDDLPSKKTLTAWLRRR